MRCKSCRYSKEIEGAFGFFDIARWKEASVKKSGRVKYFEISKMLDKQPNKTNRISKPNFVFHFFTNQREEEKVRPSKLILHFCIF